MKTVLLCILDGVGIRKEEYGNAVKQANMPVFNKLLEKCPNTVLQASEEAVGLPKGQMGNSEVGHLTIGSGRVIYQSLERINQDIKSKNFFHNKNILEIIEKVKREKSQLHLMGLLSDGGVHSHINHLFALIDMLKEENIPVRIHAFLDGRDTKEDVALTYLDQLQEKIKILKDGKIASIAGRYYAMDRDNRWNRVQKAYEVIVNNNGKYNVSYEKAIKENYAEGNMDEFIIPTALTKDTVIKDNDGIIVFNFRPDRLRELFTAITNPNFDKFKVRNLNNVSLLTMMPVSETVICKNIYQELTLNNTLGEYISNLGLTQLRIAETEKYAHVTYFFDGGEEKQLNGCKRILIDSPKVATYDLKPEMSAVEITDTLLKELDENYDLIILNFANGDMVGHTGNMNATIKALETLDSCLGKIVNKIDEKQGILLVTADHGNSDTMLDKEGNIVTSHSLSKVPFIIMDYDCRLKMGTLADIAPTILEIMDLEIPKEMTGQSLIEK